MDDPFFLGPLAVWLHAPASRRKPRARVLLVHGITEHSGRHRNTVGALTAAGFEVARFDLRGAGHSGGRRQWVARFEDYVDDVATLFNWICREREEAPLFLLGHSLGGAVAVHFAAIYGPELRGLCLSGPAYRVGDAISPMKIAVGRAFARWAPTFTLPKPPLRPAISRDAAVTDAYATDPLCFHHNTLQQGVEVLRGLSEVPERCERIHVPVLIAHGSHDRIIRLEGSFELLQRLPGGDKTLIILPGGYHEPHNDIDKEEYFRLLVEWLEKRCEA